MIKIATFRILGDRPSKFSPDIGENEYKDKCMDRDDEPIILFLHAYMQTCTKHNRNSFYLEACKTLAKQKSQCFVYIVLCESEMLIFLSIRSKFVDEKWGDEGRNETRKLEAIKPEVFLNRRWYFGVN